MVYLLYAIAGIASLVTLVCYVMVVIKMFQNGQTGLGIASLVLFFCFGIGVLLAFVFGWIKSAEWGIKNVMIAWTAAFLINIVVNVATMMMAPQLIQIPQ